MAVNKVEHWEFADTDPDDELARSLGVAADALPQRVTELRAELKEKEKQIASLNEQLIAARLQRVAGPLPSGNGPLFIEDEVEPSVDLKSWADIALGGLPQPGVVFVSSGDRYVLKVSSQLTDRLNALNLRERIGPGGGRAEFVQGKLTHPRDEVVRLLKELTR
jgi:alanyl-tRNA synthetase